MIIEERERERDDICYKYKSNWIVKDYCNFKSKEYITVDIVKENSWPQFFFFFWVQFLMKNEIRDYFYVIGWMNYKFKWSKIFIFVHTKNEFDRPTLTWAHNLLVVWVLGFLLWVVPNTETPQSNLTLWIPLLSLLLLFWFTPPVLSLLWSLLTTFFLP